MAKTTDDKPSTYETIIFLVIGLIIGIVCLICGIENAKSKPTPINTSGNTTYVYDFRALGIISLIVAILIFLFYITFGILWIYDK